MLEIAPTPTSVFTSEYWEDVQDHPTTPRVRMPKGAQGEVETLCGQAAANIFADEPREAVIAGDALDYDPDNRYTQPGVVLLTDLEVLMSHPGRHEPHSYPGSKAPVWSQRAMENPDHLIAPAAALFRANSRMIVAYEKAATVSQYPYVYPYERVLCDEDSPARYARIIGLTAFVYNQDGSTGGLTMKVWKSNNPDHPAGMPESLLDSMTYPHAPVKVGQSYKVPNDKKLRGLGSRHDISPQSDLTIRLRSAELCLQGVLERAPEKKRATRRLGRRVLSALPGSSGAALCARTTQSHVAEHPSCFRKGNSSVEAGALAESFVYWKYAARDRISRSTRSKLQ